MCWSDDDLVGCEGEIAIFSLSARRHLMMMKVFAILLIHRLLVDSSSNWDGVRWILNERMNDGMEWKMEKCSCFVILINVLDTMVAAAAMKNRFILHAASFRDESKAAPAIFQPAPKRECWRVMEMTNRGNINLNCSINHRCTFSYMLCVCPLREDVKWHFEYFIHIFPPTSIIVSWCVGEK